MNTAWHSLTYQVVLLLPFIPTYALLLTSALIPIIAGSHASLSRPSSAAAPLQQSNEPRPNRDDGEDNEDDQHPTETVQRMEGWTPTDAIVYPVLMACSLTVLYFLLQWLEDPNILNRILNLYLSAFGILSFAKLVTDSINLGFSFLFPRTYLDQGIQWEVKNSRGLAISRERIGPRSAASIQRSSPLPGRLSRIVLPRIVAEYLWALRIIVVQPAFHIRSCVHGMIEASTPILPQDIVGLLLSVAAVLHYNFSGKPWWLNNILGLSFCYEALQTISPTSFCTGTLVLLTLFVYDVYFVFFTPLMITVATSLDVPVKLLFPRSSNDTSSSQKQQFALLGLGDVVLPGILIGLALRFDLHLFYLKKQASESLTVKLKSESNVTAYDQHSKSGVKKRQYRTATGNWGERFWLGAQRDARFNGGLFPKTYFYASVMGYLLGLLGTLFVMHIFKHGQPALLYLVPAVLFAVWGTAFCRGEIQQMWEYSEANEETPKVIDEAASLKHDSDDTVTEYARPETPIRLVRPGVTVTTRYLAYLIVERAGSTKARSKELDLAQI